MKKICLLFGIILCCLSGFAQTLQSAVTVVSGGDAILTVSGESASGYISNIIYKSQTVSPATANVLVSTPEYGGPPYPIAPTKFKIKVTGYFNNLTTPITAKVIFRTLIWNQNGNANVEVDQTVTFTVTPPAGPVTIYNQPQSGVFYKNNCGAGFASDPYTYTVPAGRYSGSSQVEANNKAQAEINANGQNTANANLTCKQVYYNTEVSGSFTRNDCGAGRAGSVVNYIVAAKKYHSFTQIEADQLAAADLTSNGQSYANTTGMCTEVRKRYRAVLRGTDPCSSSGEVGSLVWIRSDLDLNKVYSQGNSRVFLYTSADGTTKVPEGNYKIMYMMDNTGEQGNRIFSVNYDGEIVGFTLCQQ